MNYTQLIKAVKDILMNIPTSRPILLWALSISCILVWKAADIMWAAVELAK